MPNVKSFRDDLNAKFEKLLARVLETLEHLPPLPELLKRAQKFKWVLIAAAGFLTADLCLQVFSAFFLKSETGKSSQNHIVVAPPYVQSRASYEETIRRNAFCPGCVVPDMKTLAFSRPKDCNKARVFPGNSLKVVGTIVLSQPQYSIATLSDGGPDSVALKVGDSFKEYGKVFEIRRDRVCFESTDGLLHYVEVPQEPLKFGQPINPTQPQGVEGISRLSDNEVEIKRTFLEKELQDPGLITKALAVPVKDPLGNIHGFKILSMEPGSVYEALGLQVDDTIKAVNGEPMDSVAKAQELYAAANSAEEVNIDIDRNGQTITKKFRVK